MFCLTWFHWKIFASFLGNIWQFGQCSISTFHLRCLFSWWCMEQYYELLRYHNSESHQGEEGKTLASYTTIDFLSASLLLIWQRTHTQTHRLQSQNNHSFFAPIYTCSQIQPESDLSHIQMESDLFKHVTWSCKPIGFQLDVAQIWSRPDLAASVNGAFDFFSQKNCT